MHALGDQQIRVRTGHSSVMTGGQQRVGSTSSTFAKAAIKLIQGRLVTPMAGLGCRAEVQVERIAMTGIKLSSHRPART